MTNSNTTAPAASSFFGSLFGGVKDLVVGVAPAVTDFYTLKVQGENLAKQNQAPQQASAPPTPAPTSTSLPAWYKPWMAWAAGAFALLTVIALIVRSRR